MFGETLDDQSINTSGSGSRSLQDVLNNGYSFGIGEAFNLGFALFKQNLWSYVGYTFIRFAISLIVGFIPIVGSLANLVLSPALGAGPFIFADKSYSNNNPQFDNFFDGFKNKFKDLILNYLITIGLILLVLLPIVIMVFVFSGFSISSLSDLSTSIVGSLAIVFILIFAIFIFGFTLLLFNTPLLLFENLSPWGAIENSSKIVFKNYGLILVLVIILALINVLGVLVIFIGLLFTIPLSVCVVYAAYTLIFEKKSSLNSLDYL